MGKLINLAGKTFGLWTVVGTEPIRRNKSTMWLCQCACGNAREVEGSSLRDGQSTNCGCSHVRLRHGLSTSMEYHSWNAMQYRCKTQKRGYENITVDPRWTGPEGFANFLADMGPRPPGTTLDRKDGTLGYSPGNCRWATRRTQNANRSNSRLVRLNGRVVTLGFAIEVMERRLRKGDCDFEITSLVPGCVVVPSVGL